MSPSVESPRDLTHILLVWALQQEEQIFRRLASYLDAHSELAFDALAQAVAEAARGDFPFEQRKSVVIRRAPLRFIDNLRKEGVKPARPGQQPSCSFVALYGGRAKEAGGSLAETLPSEDRDVDPVDRLLRGEIICPRCIPVLLRMKFSETDVEMFTLYVDGVPWTGIAKALGVSATVARKRWERLRPALAGFLAGITGLEPDFVSRMLGRRRTAECRHAA